MTDEAKGVTKRGVRKRTWVRLDCHGVLHGSINFVFTLEEQAIFLKMIAMAAIYGTVPGIISDNEGRPLPHDFIAYELHCSRELLESVLKKGAVEDSIREDSNGIELVNFNKYQFTEYDRQRPYRQAKKDDPDKYTKGKYGHMVHR